jgi:small subunit ribosomal protein S8e
MVRCRGGNIKRRALRLETGTFSWGTESISRKVKIVDVVYNASNNELVRTKTLVKNAIVVIDATKFKEWYDQFYGVDVAKNEAVKEESKTVAKKHSKRREGHALDPRLAEQLASGRLLACISSRPGQCGRADGYILEGKELEFYQRKLVTKKKASRA